MSKSGGKQKDGVVMLEEALKRFARKRETASLQNIDPAASQKIDPAPSNVRYADFSHASRHEDEHSRRTDTRPLEVSDLAHDFYGPLSAGLSGHDDQIVAIIDGVPRTLDDLQRLEAAEIAYDHDFPDDASRYEAHDETHEDEAIVAETASRDSTMPWYQRSGIRQAYSVIGGAMLVLVAFLVMQVPNLKQQADAVIAKVAPAAALKASPIVAANNDAITTLVVISDSDAASDTSTTSSSATANAAIKPIVLEARIKDTLKLRAFTDIGVSVSKMGDAFLAGEVYSVNEARKVSKIVRRVAGVRRVHFLHPSVREPQGPAYFGITTASAPEVWGAKVQTVFIGSPADKAGLRAGDVISVFDGKTVPDAKSFNDLVASYSPGQRVEFRAWQDGQAHYLVARMGELTTVASR